MTPPGLDVVDWRGHSAPTYGGERVNRVHADTGGVYIHSPAAVYLPLQGPLPRGGIPGIPAPVQGPSRAK